MTDHKKKGDFNKGKDDVGGNKKAGAKGESNSRTRNENAGHGGRG